MTDNCNIDEILRQLKMLDDLRQLRDTMGAGFFSETFPELNNMAPKLDNLIAKQEAELEVKMGECGKLDVSELPDPDTLLGIDGIEPTADIQVEAA